MNMKWFVRIVVLVALLLLGALGWQWLAADPGFVQLRIRGYVVETTVIVAVAALLLTLATLWLLLRLLRLPLQWLAGRRARRTRHAFAQAELRLREGQWARAEKQFLRAADDADFRIPALLEAAQCAHARGDAAQAQAHLLRLDDEAEGRRLAQLERAREALVGDRPEEALGLLASVDPLPPSAIGLRIDALRACHRSAEALAELPLLHKAQLHDGLQFAKLELATTRQALAEAGTGPALEQAWNQLPRGHKRSADLVAAYVERGLALGLMDGAGLVEAQLRHEWSDPLVRLYGRLDQPAPSQRLKVAEGWLATHPDSVGLNLTLGRLQQRLGQPRLAEDYFGHALAIASDAEAWEALAELYGQQQLAERAHVAAINALRARRGEAPLPLPAGPARTDNLGLFAVAEERSEHGVPRLPGASVR